MVAPPPSDDRASDMCRGSVGDLGCVGDLVLLGRSVLPEHRGLHAIVTKAAPSHCTVAILDASSRTAVGECWPGHGDFSIESTVGRVGTRVAIQGLRAASSSWCNGLTGVVAEHPREGHPVFVRRRQGSDQATGPSSQPLLVLCVRLDRPPPRGKQRQVMMEPRFLAPYLDLVSTAAEDLRNAVALAERQVDAADELSSAEPPKAAEDMGVVESQQTVNEAARSPLKIVEPSTDFGESLPSRQHSAFGELAAEEDSDDSFFAVDFDYIGCTGNEEDGVIERVVEVPQVEYREKVVEVPRVVYEERVRHVPKVEVREAIKEVERVEVQFVDRIVEVPQVEYRKRVVQIPKATYAEIVKSVSRKQVKVVDRMIEVPQVQYVERIVEMPEVEYRERVKHVTKIVEKEIIRHVRVAPPGGCPTCVAGLQSEAVFCSKCGARLDVVAAARFVPEAMAATAAATSKLTAAGA